MRGLFRSAEVAKIRDCVDTSDDIRKQSFGRSDSLGRLSRLCIWNHPGNDLLGIVARCGRQALVKRARINPNRRRHFAGVGKWQEPCSLFLGGMSSTITILRLAKGLVILVLKGVADPHFHPDWFTRGTADNERGSDGRGYPLASGLRLLVQQWLHVAGNGLRIHTYRQVWRSADLLIDTTYASPVSSCDCFLLGA